jgi:hypothetical protein
VGGNLGQSTGTFNRVCVALRDKIKTNKTKTRATTQNMLNSARTKWYADPNTWGIAVGIGLVAGLVAATFPVSLPVLGVVVGSVAIAAAVCGLAIAASWIANGVSNWRHKKATQSTRPQPAVVPSVVFSPQATDHLLSPGAREQTGFVAEVSAEHPKKPGISRRLSYPTSGTPACVLYRAPELSDKVAESQQENQPGEELAS